jgi:origin recognition complex subunit 3
VVAFQDTEAFAPSLIPDFLHRNLAPLSRLPVTFLFGVSSTLDQFQHSLPTPLIQALDFKLFQLRQNDDCLRLIVDRVLLDAGPRLRLGPRVLTLLIDRYKSWNQSIEEFISGIKVRPPPLMVTQYEYAYMCHFYANPLSVLLAVPSADPESLSAFLSPQHLNMIRSLPSMRKYVENKLSERDTEEVKSLLNDDEYLLSLLPQLIGYLENKAAELREAVLVLVKLSDRGKTKRGIEELYLNALLGDLTPETPLVRELLQLQRYPAPQTPRLMAENSPQQV